MEQNRGNEAVRRDDLRQKNEDGVESTRTGSTGGDIQATEWTPGGDAQKVSEDPHAGSYTGKGTNAGNGGDYTDR
ncbi:hypothetical protein [Paracnuella aquatica]|uniref:hypothetical protein n=1 Tax=Paracnuella aquatica TaxID=2268757 RepID=UPI000DEF7775|nr:hypothetical protein [Paracnuella aquatica]RPD48121.1 hypothetical protein DRJ53_10245 [Paracnuella aquatica]